jgi:hypothetical protein
MTLLLLLLLLTLLSSTNTLQSTKRDAGEKFSTTARKANSPVCSAMTVCDSMRNLYSNAPNTQANTTASQLISTMEVRLATRKRFQFQQFRSLYVPAVMMMLLMLLLMRRRGHGQRASAHPFCEKLATMSSVVKVVALALTMIFYRQWQYNRFCAIVNNKCICKVVWLCADVAL